MSSVSKSGWADMPSKSATRGTGKATKPCHLISGVGVSIRALVKPEVILMECLYLQARGGREGGSVSQAGEKDRL